MNRRDRHLHPCTILACAIVVIGSLALGCSSTPEDQKPQPLVVAFNQTPITPEPAREQGGGNDATSAAVSDTVRQAVLSPAAAAATRNSMPNSNGEMVAVRATTHPANGGGAGGVGTASAITLGAVVVEVNGTPIYANKVLKMIAPALAARAKEVPDLTRFKQVALAEIQEQVRLLVLDEIVFATAQRNLDKQDQLIAKRMTIFWRDDQIRRNGGSLQLARRAAEQQGVNFDELLDEQSRLWMRRVYFEKKEKPKIQVSADDMRRYYQKHLTDQFTERDQAQFRVIKVGVRQAGSRDAARSKAEDLRTRAARGEDFSQLAADFNDDPYLKKTKGDPTGNAASTGSGQGGWIDRGSFANAKLEEAVWKLQPEQVSELVESNDGYYFAKLERKKGGRQQSFDEDAVQLKIRKTLEAEQFSALRDQAERRLRQNAIVFPDPPNLAPALEMATQMYPQWAAGAGK